MQSGKANEQSGGFHNLPVKFPCFSIWQWRAPLFQADYEKLFLNRAYLSVKEKIEDFLIKRVLRASRSDANSSLFLFLVQISKVHFLFALKPPAYQKYFLFLVVKACFTRRIFPIVSQIGM